jgi:hypothetical protein
MKPKVSKLLGFLIFVNLSMEEKGLFVSHVEVCQTTTPLVALLVSLENP